MEDEVKGRIFYAEKDLKDLKDYLCFNGGKRKKYLDRIIREINNIIDFIEYVKEKEIYIKKEENEEQHNTINLDLNTINLDLSSLVDNIYNYDLARPPRMNFELVRNADGTSVYQQTVTEIQPYRELNTNLLTALEDANLPF